MSEILLRAEDARSAADFMRTSAQAATDQFEATRGRLTELANSFKGQAATAFDARFEEWRTSSRQLIEALEGLAGFLDQAATTIEQTDADIAGRLNG